MDFTDQIKALGKRVTDLKEQIQTEEATKTSFIMPFFQLLGYDVFNPLEFVPEYTADIGIKKGEKVDYAILSDGEPCILIEAKWCGEPLEKHGNQLFRYFQSTKAKFGILTNGVEYRFYTDLDETNKMDLKPFFVFDITNLKEPDIVELKKFHKSTFDVDSLFSAAEDLKYTSLIKSLFKKNIDEVDDSFASYVLSEVYEGRKTQPVIEKFKPVIKKSLNQFITDLINNRLAVAMSNTEEKGTEPAIEPVQEEIISSRIVTTEDELQAYGYIKAILRDIMPLDRISYRDFIHYFGVYCDDNRKKWICRLKLDRKVKLIIFPQKGATEISYPLETLDSIFDYSEQIIESAKRFI